MTQEHPITPPQWQVDAWCKQALAMGADIDAVFLEAARWGADQKLEACCKLLELSDSNARDFLYSARRPNPPSLKEQALGALKNLNGECLLEGFECPEKVAIIRRALESLPE